MTGPQAINVGTIKTIQCKIINGKEVQVSAKEVSSDSNTDTESE